MLVDFTVKNFRSIREAMTLSLVKGQGDELEDRNVFDPEAPATPELLRGAAIYGPNASGKSNLVKAMGVMRGIIVDFSGKGAIEGGLPVVPFLLDESSFNEPTEFEVTFIIDHVRYQYGFAATKERIVEEWLLAFPRGRAQHWIKRSFDHEEEKVIWGNMSALSGAKQSWKEATRANTLFLDTAVRLNCEQLMPIYKWFEQFLRAVEHGIWDIGFSTLQCNDEEKCFEIADFLSVADLGIDGIRLDKEEFSPDKLEDDLPESLRQEITKELDGKKIVKTKTIHHTNHGKDVLFDLKRDESTGTQKMFALAGPWLDTLEKGYTLVVDEFHDNLHPLLVKHLISLFNDPERNCKNAQLIFTTHDPTILEQGILRRDQVWFCEKDEEQTTQLFPLSDFKPRKEGNNIARRYLTGRYGALPVIGNPDRKVSAGGK